MFSVSKLNDVSYVEPNVVRYLRQDGEYDYIVLQKEATNKISRISDIGSINFNKQLYQRYGATEWERLVNLKFTDNGVDLNNLYFIRYKDVVFSITDKDITDSINKFNSLIDRYENKIVMNLYGNLQIELVTNKYEDKDTILLFDIDIKNGIYRLYPGVKKNGLIVIDSNPVNISDKDTLFNFDSFIEYDFDHEILINDKINKDSNRINYKSDIGKKISLSLREVMEILKLSGITVNSQDEDIVTYGLINEDNKIMIEEFFKSFNMPYQSIKRLSLPRKILKSNRINIDDMLSVLSKEYYNENNNVSAYTISRLLSIYYSYDSDKIAINEELKIN